MLCHRHSPLKKMNSCSALWGIATPSWWRIQEFHARRHRKNSQSILLVTIPGYINTYSVTPSPTFQQMSPKLIWPNYWKCTELIVTNWHRRHLNTLWGSQNIRFIFFNSLFSSCLTAITAKTRFALTDVSRFWWQAEWINVHDVLLKMQACPSTHLETI